MQIKFKVILVLLIALVPALDVLAGDVEAGKKLAIKDGCVGCHGSAGISYGPIWPNLAGQHGPYMENQLKLFRSGERKDPMMNLLAKPLNDKEITDLAAYFASL
ncbi:cytochrome c [Aliiglaciecola sp. NS0011-25]|uniref:c-type cytochrome n=1 Tax=Aliiglaciecola sp. NS0011-25 TaxID=3127654 RepID=UPI00310BEEF3